MGGEGAGVGAIVFAQKSFEKVDGAGVAEFKKFDDCFAVGAFKGEAFAARADEGEGLIEKGVDLSELFWVGWLDFPAGMRG